MGASRQPPAAETLSQGLLGLLSLLCVYSQILLGHCHVFDKKPLCGFLTAEKSFAFLEKRIPNCLAIATLSK